MHRDIGEYIGLIAVSSGAIILGLSYIAAYLMGRDRGRRDQDREHREMNAGGDQRLAAMESAVHGLEHTVQRLMDAQRLLVAQQDHLSRKVGTTERSVAFGAIPSKHTPA